MSQSCLNEYAIRPMCIRYERINKQDTFVSSITFSVLLWTEEKRNIFLRVGSFFLPNSPRGQEPGGVVQLPVPS